LLTLGSTGATPQQQTEQILAITPILQGQLPNEKNPIPPHCQQTLPTQENIPPAQENHVPSSEKLPTPPTVASQPPVPAQGDLVDLGQNDALPAQQYMPPADLHAAQTLNNDQKQRDLEETLRSTSALPNPKRNTGSLVDYHDDLRMNLPEVNKLKRQDTDTQSLDEFLDAEG